MFTTRNWNGDQKEISELSMVEDGQFIYVIIFSALQFFYIL